MTSVFVEQSRWARGTSSYAYFPCTVPALRVKQHSLLTCYKEVHWHQNRHLDLNSEVWGSWAQGCLAKDGPASHSTNQELAWLTGATPLILHSLSCMAPTRFSQSAAESRILHPSTKSGGSPGQRACAQNCPCQRW